MRSWTQKIVGLMVILLSFVLGWQILDYRTFANTALVVPAGGQRINIPTGSSLKSIARDLNKHGMIERAGMLEWMGRLQGKAGSIKAGEYQILPDTYPGQFLDMLVSGKVVQYSFTLVEGWSVRQMMTALADNNNIKHTLTDVTAESIMPAIGIRIPHGEGWFLPDTYFFVRDTTDKALLLRAHSAMFNQIDASWSSRAEGLPYESNYDALIMASIVEKETAVAAERSQIAGVFVRRLKKGMRLQTDPTVIYGMGEKYDGNIRLKDLRADTAYNTYTRNGLPPTPIAMPGVAAIEAALHPAEGTSLYFVAKGDGSHAFATTLEEHNQNVIKYQLNGRERPFSSAPAKKVKKSKI
jgi:UPF0755 protein